MVKTMEQLLDVVDDVMASNRAEAVEFRNGRHVMIVPESDVLPASANDDSAEEIERRLAIVRSLHGAWSDIDAEAWKKQIKEERGSDRPYPDDER